ncbi:MAG: molybdenum cofactor biosynthesis protein MoaE [Propionibacteriaceae bacterium]|jgi:molybdopterin synthase catalytic subunit|nr:molybdenum cofactor biosynthesis protein MoaE [Propionibacteriaceae bacterium]
MTQIVGVRVNAEVLDPDRFEALVRDPQAGACVTFTGVVRDHDQGRTVVGLEFEAHPDAGTILAELIAQFCADFPGLCAVTAAHRTGTLSVGEVAFVAAVSSPHRCQAFLACASLVDLVKDQLPVWKRQVYAAGDHEWVNAP